jgi:IS1 family transposase
VNQLPIEKRAQIINLLVEGSSLRATSRISGCSINTVSKLLVDIGRACIRFHDENVKGLTSKRVQCDEIWSFVYSKEKNVPEGKEDKAGDVWTWVGIDADTKLVVSWLSGSRDAECANVFMKDIASRLANRVQLTTDGLKAYLDAVEQAFTGEVDFAQLVKLYGGVEGATTSQERKYSPVEYTGAKKTPVSGNPENKYISTSYVERQNLTMRMHMRRFTRLTNAFSKKMENHACAIALHFVYYNWCKIHKTLRVTPAMEAGLTHDIMEIKDIVNLIDAYSEAA